MEEDEGDDAEARLSVDKAPAVEHPATSEATSSTKEEAPGEKGGKTQDQNPREQADAGVSVGD